MWKELNIDDERLFEIANLRNLYSCAMNFSDISLINNLNNKTDCHYYFYEDSEYKILIGFKFNNLTKKITYLSYTISKLGDIAYIRKGVNIIAEKTKNYLKERDQSLLYSFEGMDKYNKMVMNLGGVEIFLNMAKEEYTKVGIKMTIDYKQKTLEMSL